jgi:hypothetical protein
VQVLAYRYGNLLQERQKQAIARALEQGRWSTDRKTCIVIVDRSCRSIIDRVMGDLRADGKLKSIVRGTAVLDGVRYDLGSGHHEQLLNYFASDPAHQQEGE